MDDTRWVVLGGLHSLAFGLFHLAFWKLFHWKRELARLSVANRAVMQILNLRLTYVFLAVAALCFLFPAELAGTPLGRAMLVVMSLFWLGRAIEQLVFLPLRHPAVHLLTLAFLAGAAVFALPLVN
jgi:hypothetical protein